MLVTQSCPTLPPHGLQPSRLLRPWDSPGKNTAVGSHSLLQGIFPTKGLILGLLHCRQFLYHLSHQDLMHIRMLTQDFPGGPVVKTPCFQCRDATWIPGEGAKIPHATCCNQKIKNTELFFSFFFFVKNANTNVYFKFCWKQRKIIAIGQMKQCILAGQIPSDTRR